MFTGSSEDVLSSGGEKTWEPSHSPSSVRDSLSDSASSIWPAKVKLPVTHNGPLEDSRSEEKVLDKGGGVHERFRRLLNHDAD